MAFTFYIKLSIYYFLATTYNSLQNIMELPKKGSFVLPHA
ncbi:hypothetical protein BTU51_0246 [Rickettsia rickettsii]|uniref:Uncharacterized protein n=1 Tax=Rickettsia rickettsii (strain Iowa) TaxID=452659 RepID=B0BWD2_RICRO|nr:hypothetical protein RrIowa_0246 [Rickettsia rickettsii str. Iowa]AFB23138.1 hypothetical protein RPL_01125 [Rickettsia rickettsii str. Colombia]APU55110.1 hypothetical protein BTU50_0246 [Rickettsia rickettsii]APU56487.1 hypothetical protein BTU51_0246 [Rickettsia rickettsii]